MAAKRVLAGIELMLNCRVDHRVHLLLSLLPLISESRRLIGQVDDNAVAADLVPVHTNILLTQSVAAGKDLVVAEMVISGEVDQ